VQRYGVFLTASNSTKDDVGARLTEQNFRPRADDGATDVSPVSGTSSGSQRKLKNLFVSNTPEDVARRRVEEAIAFGDKTVPHEGSAATLKCAKRYHLAPARDSGGPKDPVDKPKAGPISEGKGAWKTTSTWRPSTNPQCEFDWFMERPMPVDKRPPTKHTPEYWKTMSDIIEHEGEHAGLPKIPYSSVKYLRGATAYGGVQDIVPTYINARTVGMEMP